MVAIRHIRGKGRGVIATRHVPAGTEITSCPVIIYDSADAGRIEKTRLARYNFRFGDHRSCVVLGVISLCNHSDTPNATLVPSEVDEMMRLVALRAIAPGEEICIKYRRPLWFTPAA